MLLYWALQHQPNREHVWPLPSFHSCCLLISVFQFLVNHYEDLTALFVFLDKQLQSEDQSKHVIVHSFLLFEAWPYPGIYDRVYCKYGHIYFNTINYP